VRLWQTLMRRGAAGSESRYSFSDFASDKAGLFNFGGMSYPLFGMSSLGNKNSEEIENSFSGYVQGAYKTNGVVFATSLSRMLLFSEARFQWQRISSGRPGDLFGDTELAILERPWPNGTTGELLSRMEQDVTNAGNFYAVREGARLRRLRPDWVSIVLTAPPDEAVQSDVAGYLYRPGGLTSKAQDHVYLPEEVAHWSPVPDPEAQYRGMSWITPVLQEIRADKATTLHKARFFDNAATPNLAVSFKETVTEEQFKAFMDAMNNAHQGAGNAYKTLYLGGGADVKVVGADLKQLDFKSTQGAGETRITAAGGVPAVIVGLSEGLQAATYSNYGQARRKFGDHWARPQWRSACAALEPLLRKPSGTVRLWYDDRDIAFLREDKRDAAEIQGVESRTIRTLIDAGYEPDTVVAAVASENWTLLKHSGLYSVQLQAPGSAVKTPAGGG
jgi:phage portal protein BeeE